MTDETTLTVTVPNIPEGALVQIRVHPLSKKAVRVCTQEKTTAILGPGQGIIGMIPEDGSWVALMLAGLDEITHPTDPQGPEGAPVPAEAEAPRIALV